MTISVPFYRNGSIVKHGWPGEASRDAVRPQRHGEHFASPVGGDRRGMPFFTEMKEEYTTQDSSRMALVRCVLVLSHEALVSVLSLMKKVRHTYLETGKVVEPSWAVLGRALGKEMACPSGVQFPVRGSMRESGPCRCNLIDAN